ncbi:MAG: hypothetical protein U9Q33_07440 [Campylobacterota bacterium]|nr:hypothetical protein [Campylobacterota bacterium]
MRKALIDQMLLWIVLFVAFVTVFYVILNYYNVIRAKDKSDSIVNYGVRMKALGRSDSSIVAGLNDVKGSYFDTIVDDDLNCVEDNTTADYQVIFTSNISIGSNMFLNQNENITSQAAAFNEASSFHIDCNLNLRPQ